MGLGKPTGFTMWVWWVQVQCRICRPMPTPYPSRVTCRFQPPIPTLTRAGGCICLHRLTHFNSKLHSLSPPHHLSLTPHCLEATASMPCCTLNHLPPPPSTTHCHLP